MKTENAILMKQARESLKGKWSLVIGAFVTYALIMIVANSVPKIGSLISLVITGPMTLGITIFSLAFSRNKENKFSQIFEGFNKFWVSFKTYLLKILFTFLWTLLLIVPGIIAAISYSQAFYILADDSSIGAREAIRRSKEMMNGYKWKYFCLCFRFLGWMILAGLTLGIGLIWLIPYMQISMAKFYDDLVGKSPVQV